MIPCSTMKLLPLMGVVSWLDPLSKPGQLQSDAAGDRQDRFPNI